MFRHRWLLFFLEYFAEELAENDANPSLTGVTFLFEPHCRCDDTATAVTTENGLTTIPSTQSPCNTGAITRRGLTEGTPGGYEGRQLRAKLATAGGAIIPEVPTVDTSNTCGIFNCAAGAASTTFSRNAKSSKAVKSFSALSPLYFVSRDDGVRIVETAPLSSKASKAGTTPPTTVSTGGAVCT